MAAPFPAEPFGERLGSVGEEDGAAPGEGDPAGVDPPEGPRGPGDVGPRGAVGVEVDTLAAGQVPGLARHGGDQGGELPVRIARVAVEEPGVEAKGGMVAPKGDAKGAEVALGVRAREGLAERPEPERRVGALARVLLGGEREGRWRGSGGVEEDAGLVEGAPEGDAAEQDAQEVEEVAPLTGAGVVPAPGPPGRGEAHPQGAPRFAVDVARAPVSVLAVSVGEVVGAKRGGVLAERS